MIHGRHATSDRALIRRWAMAAILLLSFSLRVHRIGDQRVWWDEGWSVWVARFSPLEILRQTGNDVHPPLYFELLHLWRALSGDSEAGLRLLSAFLAALTIALTYALGRRMARGSLPDTGATLVGLLAALFLGVSRFAIAWSQEIRMYALASLLAVLAVWMARRVWARGLRRDALLYVLATAAGMYTLYLFAPVWMAINVAWLWHLRDVTGRRREFVRWVGLQLITLALFLPWLRYAAGGFLSTAAATPISLVDFFHIYWTVLTVGIPVDVAQFNRLTIPAAAIFLTAVTALVVRAARMRATRATTGGGRQSQSDEPSITTGASDEGSPVFIGSNTIRDLILLLAVLLLPAIIVYLVSLPKQSFYNPPFNPRYLVIFTSFYSILLAWGLATVGEWLSRRRATERGSRGAEIVRWGVPIGLSAVMIALALVGLWPYYPGRVLVDDYPSLVDTIDAYRRPGDAVVLYTDTDWPIFAYHYPQPWRGVPHLWAMTPETVAGYLEPIWNEHDAVWLVTTPYSASGDPQRTLPAWLAERATAVREFIYKDMALTLFTRTNERAALAGTLISIKPSRSLDISLPDGGRLTGYSQAARDFKSGDVIHLFLYWTGENEIDTEVGLVDASGAVWQPTAITLPKADETARRQVDLVVPPEAPSGEYRFSAIGEAGRPIPFGDLTVNQKQSTFLTPDDVTIANRLDAQFGDTIRLLGYDLAQTTIQPGDTVNLTLYWSSDGDVRQRYKVFTHLLGDVFNATGGNFLWGQADNEPAANTRPTTTWRRGEVIVDEYAIPVAAGAPPGAYRIEVGLYDPVTGQRLPVLGPDGTPADDHLVITDVSVQ